MQRAGASATTLNHHDANGHLVGVTGQGQNNEGNTRVLLNDHAGRVLRREQDGHVTHTLIANGEIIGTSSDQGAPVADTFGSSYIPISDASLSGGPGSYTVQAGDTLQSIAKAMWGNAGLWYRIADANSVDAVSEGDVITIPARSNTIYNDHQTYEPYNPAQAVGDTTPTLPMPAGAGGGCGGVGQVIMLAVAVIATIYTAGAAAAAIGGAQSTAAASLAANGAFATGSAAMGGAYGAAGFTGSMVGGAVGSIASQAVGVTIGAQDSFNWKGVALGALSAGVTAGVGSMATGVLAGQTTGAFIGRAALGNALTQGIAVVTGLQDKFDWRGVAASAVGAGVGQAAGTALNGAGFGLGNVGNQIASGTLRGLAAGTAAAVMRGGKVAIQQIATDAFGNALGSSLAGASSGASNPASSHGYVNEMDRASDNYNPASDYGYRNAMDRASDAYNPSSAYGHRNGMDVASDAFNPASLSNHRNGADLASDQAYDTNRLREQEAAGERILKQMRDSATAKDMTALNRQSAASVARERVAEQQRESTRLDEMARANGRDPQRWMREIRMREDESDRLALEARLANGPKLSAWDGKSTVASKSQHPFYGTFQHGIAKSLPDAAFTIALPEIAIAKAAPWISSATAWGSKFLTAGETVTRSAGLTYEGVIASVPGRVLGEFNQMGIAGPLAGGAENTFSGGRYALIELDKPTTLYRGWAPGQSREFGGFWSLEKPVGSLQSRIDSALLPEWGTVHGTVFRSQATHYTAIEVPAGTRVFAGEVASQGGTWVGGRSQLLIEGGAKEAWKTGGGQLR